jgi:ABC-2 type transport system permease protein
VSIVRTELRLLRHDPVPAAVLVGMPLVLMTLLSDAMESTLATEGYPGAPGSAQTVPGMACVFASFAIAVVGFAIFREHGWRTWPRLRAAGLCGRALLTGKLAVPAGLVAAQHGVLFGFGVLFLDLRVSGSWLAVGLIAAAFAALVLTAGVAAAAALSTIQQVNAVTNLGAMALGGLGGGFVPVESLPDWIEPIAPISPVYWAMKGYRSAILDGGGVGDVLGPLVVLVAFTAVFAGIALWRLELDAPKRTWG